MRKTINVVWIKRDIRSQDHVPLARAEQYNEPYMLLFMFEPSITNRPDVSVRHLQFQYLSLLKLCSKLEVFGKKLYMCMGEAIEVFEMIQRQFSIKTLLSYQESGTKITYLRDKKVASYCQKYDITWHQFERDGVVRGLKNRNGWDTKWHKTMSGGLLINKYAFSPPLFLRNEYPLDQDFLSTLSQYPKNLQPPGEENAYAYLDDFSKIRGRGYKKLISKPTESRFSCTRISPYLSWGNISLKQSIKILKDFRDESDFKSDVNGALTRLKWRSHFVQKFETDCSYETVCLNRGYELVDYSQNGEHLKAWQEAKTGFPLVDACMICLKKTGWLNFRMRAMLVSFLCHHLFLDWRMGVYHLARLFTDYEPGIHYSQFQMQAGTTGINTIRIYNPVKQSKEHDPAGKFIKTWLPQLDKVPCEQIHEPHRLTPLEQKFYGVPIGSVYPMPIVDINISGKEARYKLWGHRNNKLVQRENRRIVSIHTRNRKKQDKSEGSFKKK